MSAAQFAPMAGLQSGFAQVKPQIDGMSKPLPAVR